MATFSVTPVGPFPTSTDDGFPQFLQWQDEGSNLGGPDVETVNVVGDGVTAKRGTGETEKVLTIEVLGSPSLSLQFQDHGSDLGAADATVVNLTGSLIATRTDVTIEIAGPTLSVDQSLTIVQEGDTITLGVAPFAWRDVPGDTVLEITDAENGLSMSATSGTQIVLVPGDTGDPNIDLQDGAAVLVYQEGAGGVAVHTVSGVILNVRSALTTTLAGQFATATLLKRRANEWILCGDLATA